MRRVHACCCGLDVHKKTVVACLITTDAMGAVHQELRTFGTMVPDLRALLAWLQRAGCQHVAMESTGVYWKPIFNLLEHHLHVMLVNAQHVHQLPGRKTDLADAAWLAELLQHGLLSASFIPPAPQRAVRELTRYRTTLTHERAQVVNRLQKILEDANIKLGDVVSRVLGVAGRAILEALIEGVTIDAAFLARVTHGRMRAKRQDLLSALQGDLYGHHRFLLRAYLRQIDSLDAAISLADQEIAIHLASQHDSLALLETIPGVGRRTAEILMAEVGMTITAFPSARHLAAWAGMAPGNCESAGKRLKGRRRQGNRWLRHALVEAGNAAARTKHTYLAAQYHRLAGRRGRKRAVVAVGHSILVIAYHLLTRREPYRDLGPTYFDAQARAVVERRLIRRLEQFGYTVSPPQPQLSESADDGAATILRQSEAVLARKRLPLDWRPPPRNTAMPAAHPPDE